MAISKPSMMHDKLLIGRNEWCQLPDINIPAIKAKIDTGAKTSALHAFNIKPVLVKNKEYVYFDVLPIQGKDEILIHCKAPIFDERYIMSSNGHREHRYVIQTSLMIGTSTWEIELTLSNRDPLRFRMLLGRQALNHRTLINPGVTCIQGKLTKKKVATMYRIDKRR